MRQRLSIIRACNIFLLIALILIPGFASALDADWWNKDYQFRRQILFGQNHDMIDSGATIELPFESGYEKRLPVDNCLSNEGIGQAVYCKNITYLSYLGHKEGEKNLWVFVIGYDHTKGKFGKPYPVSDGYTESDSHNVPSMLVDNSGYLHIFYGAHTGSIYYRKSLLPCGNDDGGIGLNQLSWSKEIIINDGAALAYPAPVIDDDGSIYLFTRHKMYHLGYFKINSVTQQIDSAFYRIVDYEQSGYDDQALYLGGVRIVNGRCHIVFTFWDYYSSLLGNKGRAIGYLFSDDFVTWRQYIPGEKKPIVAGKTNGVGDDMIDFNNCYHIIESSDQLKNWPDSGPFYHTSGTLALEIDRNNRPCFLVKSWERCIGERCKLHLVELERNKVYNWKLTDLSSDLNPTPPLMFRYRQGGNLILENDSLHIYYLAPPPDPVEQYYSAELYRLSRDNRSRIWNGQYLTANTGYGAGILSTPQLQTQNERYFFQQRCQNLFLAFDKDKKGVLRTGDDIRIIRKRYIDSIWNFNELDIVPDRFSADDGTIYFQLMDKLPYNRDLYDSTQYFIYYGNPLAMTPPRNPHNIFTMYESFESDKPVSKIIDKAGWSGEKLIIGNPKSISCNNMPILNEAHTNKLWSGSKFLYFKPQKPGGYAITREFDIPLDQHSIKINIWPQSGGNYFYIELYDEDSGNFIRLGLLSHFCSREKDKPWVIYHKQPARPKRFHSINAIIDSSGVSFIGDGNLIFENNSAINKVTHLRIGADYDSGEYFIDDLVIKRHYNDPPKAYLDSLESIKE